MWEHMSCSRTWFLVLPYVAWLIALIGWHTSLNGWRRALRNRYPGGADRGV